MLWTEFATLVRYGLVGLANTALCGALMYLFSRLGLPYPVYSAIGYLAGIALSFSLNRTFTFSGGKDRAGRRLVRFLATNFSLLGLAQLIQAACIEGLAWPELAGVACGMVAYTGIGYVANRLWVFAPTAVRGGAGEAAER